MIDVGDRLVLIQDGVQVWRNDRLAETAARPTDRVAPHSTIRSSVN